MRYLAATSVRRVRLIVAAAVVLVALFAVVGLTMVRDRADSSQQAVDRYVSAQVSGPRGVQPQRSVIVSQDSDRASAELTWVRPDGELGQRVVLEHIDGTIGIGGGWAVVDTGSA